MCPGCRALLDGDEPACPYCGWNLRATEVRRQGGGVDRALRPTGGVVRTIILANVILFVATAYVQVLLASRLYEERTDAVTVFLDGLMSPRHEVVRALGGNVASRVWVEHEWWRLLAPVFLHYGVLHLAMNMMALHNVGAVLEDVYGGGKALAVYLLLGLAASAARVAWWGDSGFQAERAVAAGASGAIMGVIGVLAGLGFRVRGPTGRALLGPALRAAGLTLLLGFIVPQIDNVQHVAGFVAGLPCGYFLSFGVRAKGDPDAVRRWDVAAFLLALATVASFVPPALGRS